MKLTAIPACLLWSSLLFVNACSGPRNSKGELTVSAPSWLVSSLSNPESVYFLNSDPVLTGPGNRSERIDLMKILSSPIPLVSGDYKLELLCGTEHFEIKNNQKTEIRLKGLAMNLPLASTNNDLTERGNVSIKCDLAELKKVKGAGKLNSDHSIVAGLFPSSTERIYIGLNKFSFDEFDLKIDLYPIQLVAPEGFRRKSFGYYFPNMLTGLQITDRFEVGKVLFLPNGIYNLEINGSKKSLKVEKGADTPQEVQLTSVTGKAPDRKKLGISQDRFYFLNKTAELKFGEKYLIFPGIHSVSFSENEKVYPVEASGKKPHHEFDVDAVYLLQKCPPWELECKHHKKFALFEKNKRYPFARGTSESLLYYFAKPDLEIANLGTFALRKKLGREKKVVEAKIGTFEVRLNSKQHDFLETEFVRIEPLESDMNGASFDLSFHKKNKLTLFTGKYAIAQYTLNKKSKKRKRTTKKIIVSQSKGLVVDVTVYKKSPISSSAVGLQSNPSSERMKIF